MNKGVYSPVPAAWQLLVAGFSFLATAATISASGMGERAQAQVIPNHNSNAPIDVSADSLDVASREGRASYSGNVTVRQDRLTMRAGRVSVAFSTAGGIDINRVEATGNVVVTADDLNARGNVALYDLDSRLITMIGNVELTQRGNRLSGNRLVINVGSGRANLTGGTTDADGSSTGGRVTGRFTVRQRPNPQ
jgi:lipopolysaccharide export system protein LptA